MNGLLALAFGAGMIAPINPCGFAVLPAVLAYTATGEHTSAGLAARISRGLRAGAALTIGFAGTFTVLGVAAALGLRQLIGAVPWAATVLAAMLTLAGLVMLAGRHIPIRLPGPHFGRNPQRPLDMLLYGVGYAIASASCSIAILLSVISQALATSNVSGLLVVFGAYTAGSATLLLTVALLAAVANTVATQRMRPLMPHMTRIAGTILFASGVYLLHYWIPQLTGHRLPPDPLATGVARVGTWITTHQTLVATAAFAIIAISTALVTLPRRTHPAAASDTHRAATAEPASTNPTSD